MQFLFRNLSPQVCGDQAILKTELVYAFPRECLLKLLCFSYQPTRKRILETRFEPFLKGQVIERQTDPQYVIRTFRGLLRRDLSERCRDFDCAFEASRIISVDSPCSPYIELLQYRKELRCGFLRESFAQDFIRGHIGKYVSGKQGIKVESGPANHEWRFTAHQRLS